MMKDRCTRRRMVLAMGMAAACGAASSCRRANGRGFWRVFTESEARTVEAICEQLIPADQDPGAKDAGVVSFIDLQLAHPYRRYRQAYRDGIAAVEKASLAKCGKSFAAANPDQQAEILREIEESSPVFFELILNHTRQGFYGDPRHGGNRNMASWKMLRLPFPQVRGRQHYPDAQVG